MQQVVQQYLVREDSQECLYRRAQCDYIHPLPLPFALDPSPPFIRLMYRFEKDG